MLTVFLNTQVQPGDVGYSQGDYTANFGGTSAAAPFVSGAIAFLVVKSNYPPSFQANRGEKDEIHQSEDRLYL